MLYFTLGNLGLIEGGKHELRFNHRMLIIKNLALMNMGLLFLWFRLLVQAEEWYASFPYARGIAGILIFYTSVLVIPTMVEFRVSQLSGKNFSPLHAYLLYLVIPSAVLCLSVLIGFLVG